jgi:hypothetical protein
VSAAANTNECFTEFIGRTVVGVMFDAFPPARHDLSAGTKTLIFDDGRGLTISSKGTFWIEREEVVQRAIAKAQHDLDATQKRLGGVLALAGQPAAFDADTAPSAAASAPRRSSNERPLGVDKRNAIVLNIST